MSRFTNGELKMIALLYAILGAVLFLGILFANGCTYVEVFTDDVIITGEIGHGTGR
jgi:hypothetical protein